MLTNPGRICFPVFCVIIFLSIAPVFASDSPQRTLQFSGYTWDIKEGENLGPANNNWSSDPKHVWVDNQGRLHVTITQKQGRWYSTEVICREQFGYGKYIFQLEGRVDRLDPNVVLGLFTYLDIDEDGRIEPERGDGEIDIEFSRFGNPYADFNALYVIQPVSAGAPNRESFEFQLNGLYSSHSFFWKPGEVFFQSLHGLYNEPPESGFIIHQKSIVHPYVPVHSEERVRINFWIYTPNPSSSPLEIIINRFIFEPYDSPGEPTPTPSPQTRLHHWELFD